MFKDIKFEESFREKFKASCRVQAKNAIGSATIIYSKDGLTYALTNHHVIAKNIEYKDAWDNMVKAEIKKEYLSPVEILFPRMEGDQVIGYSTALADIIIYDEAQDIALLQFKDNVKYPATELYTRDKAKDIPVLTALAVIGAGLGETPLATFGNLNGKQKIIDNYEYWLSSAQSIFGNSGGGVFAVQEEEWKFIGIPSRIAVTGSWSPAPITHMGFFIPVFRIYDWLESNCYQFLYDESISIEESNRLRDKRRQEKRMEILSKMQ